MDTEELKSIQVECDAWIWLMDRPRLTEKFKEFAFDKAIKIEAQLI